MLMMVSVLVSAATIDKRNCPPGNVAVGEKVVPHRPLPFAKAQAEQRDPRQVRRDNQQVDPIQSQVIPS